MFKFCHFFAAYHRLSSCNAQCADSEVRNAIERTPYVVVLKFHVFILISKSFNFRSPLDRILRYLTKTWFYTLNFKKNPCWWLSIGYWVIENDSVSDTEQGIWTYEILWLTTQNKVFLCPLPIYIITELGAMSPGDLAVLQLSFCLMTQYSILSHYKLLSIEYWVIKDTESLYCSISTLCIGLRDQHLTTEA